MKNKLLGLVLAGLLASCASTEKVDKEAQITSGWSVEQLYTEADNELTSKNYTRAIKLYDILMARYPYGKFAEQALLDKAYAYYRYEEKDKALAAIAEFQKLYPRHPRTDYVLFLKGLVEFDERNQTFLDRLSDQDWSERDPASEKKSYAAFEELVERFPQSRYAGEARKRMEELIEALGSHEVAIARYYYQMGAFIAAADRAKNVLNDFKNTHQVEEALALMMSSYDRLGEKNLSYDARRLLELNYPQSVYLKKGRWFDAHVQSPWEKTRHTLKKVGEVFNINNYKGKTETSNHDENMPLVP